MQSISKSEYIIEEVVGCGPFQVVFAICTLLLSRIATVFTMLVMMFGNYNPGWKCLDSNNIMNNYTNNGHNIMITPHKQIILKSQVDVFYANEISTSNNNNNISVVENDMTNYNCSVYESCERIEFSLHTSTIVSEWGLLCDKTWITSLIISIQMAGVMLGCSLAGYLADAFGRKTIMYVAQAALVVFNTASIFSTSWQMFATLRFFLGMALACNLSIHNIYTVEFVTKKWRGPLCTFPEWIVCSALFSVVCMWLKDWRQIHIVTTVLAAVGFIPVVWIPESLRWLEVKNKMNKFERAAKKIAAMNGKILPPMKDLQNLSILDSNNTDEFRTYNVFHLLRKEYRKTTVLLTVPWLFISLVFYAIGFGVKVLYGNFYINLIIMNSIGLPFTTLSMLLPNLLGRKKSGIILSLAAAILIMAAVCFDKLETGNVRTVAVVICVVGGKVFASCFWFVLTLYTLEIYPTVVRGLGVSWGNAVARIGGIMAPFLIPKDKNNLTINFLLLGAMMVVCCVVFLKLPTETMGRRLQETFGRDDNTKSTRDRQTNLEDNVIVL